MHDVTYANEIMRALNEKLKSLPGGSKITAVSASLSLMSHVKPETLTETFKAMVKGTPLDKIAIKITPRELGIKYRACKHEFMVDKPVTACPKCRSSDLNIVYSKEFTVDSVEVD